MTDSVYYFDPDGDACEFCQSMAGVYVDETPIRPHDNCDCEIIEYTIGEGEDNCEVEYRDIGVSEGYGSHDVSFDMIVIVTRVLSQRFPYPPTLMQTPPWYKPLKITDGLQSLKLTSLTLKYLRILKAPLTQRANTTMQQYTLKNMSFAL